MDIIVILPALLLGMILIVIVPFAVLITIFIRSIEDKSKGLLTLLGGFLMMCMGYLFMFVIALSWSGSTIVSTAFTSESMILEANFVGVTLFTIPVVWVVVSIMIMKEGYSRYKKDISE